MLRQPDGHREIRGFTTKSNALTNVLVTEVYVSEAFDPRQTTNPPAMQKFVAIWDTGATGSVISQRVVAECGLNPIGMRKVFTASGEDLANIYIVNVFLPNDTGISNMHVTEGNLIGSFDVLIGMDIIANGDLLVTNKGSTAFSFQMPSDGGVSILRNHLKNLKKPFVQPSVPAHESPPKVGRNDPCPCGSGKKFKKCYGR